MTEDSGKSADKVADLAARRAGRHRQRRCPVCGAPAQPDHRPFCSRRCADIDLGRWLKEGYRIPTAEAPGDDERGPASEDD